MRVPWNPSDGKTSDGDGDHISRYVGGRAVGTWTNWDTLGWMQQLGVIPTTGAGEG